MQDHSQQAKRTVRATEEMKKSRLLEKSLQEAEKRREAEGWSMRAGKGVKASKKAHKPPAPSPTAQQEQREPVDLGKKRFDPGAMDLNALKRRAQDRRSKQRSGRARERGQAKDDDLDL